LLDFTLLEFLSFFAVCAWSVTVLFTISKRWSNRSPIILFNASSCCFVPARVEIV